MSGWGRHGLLRGVVRLGRVLVRSLQGQCHCVLAVLANGATAVTRPQCELPIGRNDQLYRHLIGFGHASLHLAFDVPATIALGFDVGAHHARPAEKIHATRPGPLVTLGLQRIDVKPREA